MSKYVHITDEERDVLVAILYDRLPSFLNRLKYEWGGDELDPFYRGLAHNEWQNDDCNIDDNALVSVGSEGAWVHAWVWVAEPTDGELDPDDDNGGWL